MSKYDSVLYLKGPKLLNAIISNSNSGKSTIEFNSMLSQPSYDFVSEKKNKVNYKTVDFIENKKNKNKHKNKIKNKVYIDKNISSITDDLEINDISVSNFVRNSKNKKSNKDKVSVDNNQFTDNINHDQNIYLNDLLTVQELAVKLHIASTDIIKWLFLQGISVTINQLLDISISTLVAEHYSFNVLIDNNLNNSITKSNNNNQLGQLRAPVITLLGHVDHGKTTLLKAIKQDTLLIQEVGDITQSIKSYEILIDNCGELKKLIFLDTPGHEAFVGMRSRGADITDLVILVVSADDGLKPQTIEAINHIQSRGLSFIVAINKVDKPEANIDRVKKQLLKFNISDYDKHGNNIIIEVSALNGKNINSLLSSIIVLSKAKNLRSDTLANVEGTILEAHLDKQRGPVAQLLIQNGTLHVGDFIVAGNLYGKVKAIHNSLNQKVDLIASTSLADVLCFAEVPSVGLSFKKVNNEKIAKILASKYSNLSTTTPFTLLNNRISLDDINHKGVKSIVKQVNLIIKTNTQGSIDAIMHTLANLPQEKVQINLLLIASGEVSCKDIELAFTSDSIILVFDLNISSSIVQYAERRKIVIHKFNVIYDLIDYVKRHMLAFVDVDYEKQILGYAEVKNLFFVNKGVVAGCSIQDGKLKKNSYFQVNRANMKVYNGLIDSLKRVKEDIDEVFSGDECGILCKEYNLWQVGDILECYELKPLEKTL